MPLTVCTVFIQAASELKPFYPGACLLLLVLKGGDL